MTVKILYFGIARDITSRGAEEFEVAKGSTISIFFNFLKEKYPGFDSINDYSFAINEEYNDINTVLKNHDVMALIPPVSGG